MMTVALSFTEALERPSVRAPIATLITILLVFGCWDLGERLVNDAPRYSECLDQAAPSCVGQKLLLGGDAVFQDERLTVRILSRHLVTLEAWPSEIPFPTEGEAISVQGIYRGEGLLHVTAAAVYPLAYADLWLGCLSVLVWLVALAVFVRQRWQQRPDHG